MSYDKFSVMRPRPARRRPQFIAAMVVAVVCSLGSAASAREGFDNRLALLRPIDDTGRRGVGRRFQKLLTPRLRNRGVFPLQGDKVSRSIRRQDPFREGVHQRGAMAHLAGELDVAGVIVIRMLPSRRSNRGTTLVPVLLRVHDRHGELAVFRMLEHPLGTRRRPDAVYPELADAAADLLGTIPRYLARRARHGGAPAPPGWRLGTHCARRPTGREPSTHVPRRPRWHKTPAWLGHTRFPDVPRKHWAYPSVARLDRLGLLEGYGVRLDGNKRATRYEMIVLVDRALRSLEDRLHRTYR